MRVPETVPLIDAPVWATGTVPDPGSVAGTTRYLREDGTWNTPAGGGGGGVPSVTLGNTFATNQPFTLQATAGVIFAQPVTSIQAGFPLIDGISLTSGHLNDVVPAIMSWGQESATPLAPPGSDGSVLYLSQTGTLTATIPSAGAGDVWFCVIARRLNSTTIIFSPETPVKLA